MSTRRRLLLGMLAAGLSAQAQKLIAAGTGPALGSINREDYDQLLDKMAELIKRRADERGQDLAPDFRERINTETEEELKQRGYEVLGPRPPIIQ